MTSTLLIHPGDSFSTSDVYDGLHAGLVANGITVHEARLDQGLEVFSVVADMFKNYPAPDWARDAFALAAPRIVQQAAWLQPDLVIAVTGLKLHYSVPLIIRKLGIPIVLLCTESPYNAEERTIAQFYDHIFTNERRAVPLFTAHPSVHYLPHAYHPTRHTPGPREADKECDVFFVGTAFPERRKLLDGVNWEGINRVVKGSMWDWVEDRAFTTEEVADGTVDPLQGVTENTEVLKWYRSAKINLNHHRTTTEYGSGGHVAANSVESLGPRAYEIAACGGFQLCDDSRAELHDVFSDTVPTYRAGDSANLERVIRECLKYPGGLRSYAQAQREAVLPHSWTNRAKQLLEIIS